MKIILFNMDIIIIAIGLLASLYLLLIYPKQLKKKYYNLLEAKNKKEAINAGRKYYNFGKMMSKSAAELSIQNDLKSHGLD